MLLLHPFPTVPASQIDDIHPASQSPTTQVIKIGAAVVFANDYQYQDQFGPVLI